MTDYQKQANDFLEQTGTTLSFKFSGHDYHFEDDKEMRDIWKITIKRGKKRWVVKFGQSISDTGKQPTAYDILTCLEKYDVGSFENFCSEFGYDLQPLSSYPKVMKIYKGVQREYQKLIDMYTEDEMELLREIQ